MLNINEQIQALDIAEALQGETGLFEVVDQGTGQKYVLATKPGHSVTTFRVLGNGGTPKGFAIRKVANYGEPWSPGH